MLRVCRTSPLRLYCTIVLEPLDPSEAATLPYSAHNEPLPRVSESGCVAPPVPVAKTVLLSTVGILVLSSRVCCCG